MLYQQHGVSLEALPCMVVQCDSLCFSLCRLTGRHPFNCEPPLPHLMTSGFITPTSLHYVRSAVGRVASTCHAWLMAVASVVLRSPPPSL